MGALRKFLADWIKDGRPSAVIFTDGEWTYREMEMILHYVDYSRPKAPPLPETGGKKKTDK